MTIRITWRRVLLTLVGLAVLAFLIAWSGVVRIAASSGHWKITYHVLHWSMEKSVRTHAALTSPEDSAADGGLVSAAGHFAQACAACHGAPGINPLPVMQEATPQPPNLQERADQWTDKELYWILRHGIKFSAMPAWAAAGRPDEVRRMVAFVRQLPTMSPTRYRALVGGADGSVAGTTDGPAAKCTGCHGTDGRGRGQPDVPVLAGQQAGYLYASLRAYQDGRRHSALMKQAAAQLRDEEMRTLADWFAAKPGLSVPPNADRSAAVRPASAAPQTAVRSLSTRPSAFQQPGRAAPGMRGRTAVQRRAELIFHRGLPERQIPACANCHDRSRAGPYPIIHGQHSAYVANRLWRWRGPEDVVDARKSQEIMPTISRRLPEDVIDPLAAYIQSLTSGSGERR